MTNFNDESIEARRLGLGSWGWDDDWESLLSEATSAGGIPGRVTGQERDRWTVHIRNGIVTARFTTSADRATALPVVGDWVVVTPGPQPADPCSLVATLPRRTAISRGAAGDGPHEQCLAANIDQVWIVHGLDTPPNLRRLERYLAVAWQSGAQPVIVLTKTDLAKDLESWREEVGGIAIGAQIRTVSSHDSDSIAALQTAVHEGQTVVLLGPSGAGKSTLVNLLSGLEVASTGEVREADRKGRHTTTRRELFHINGGGMIIDTPGLRELRLWDSDEGLGVTFSDIEGYAEHCRFGDCLHDTEPGCAVKMAAQAGDLAPDRLEAYRKLQAEAAHERRKVDPLARKAAVSDYKSAFKTLRFHPKRRERDGK